MGLLLAINIIPMIKAPLEARYLYENMWITVFIFLKYHFLHHDSFMPNLICLVTFVIFLIRAQILMSNLKIHDSLLY